MSEKIECGKFLDAVKKISDMLFKAFDKLVDIGLKFEDNIDEPEEGVKVFHATTGGGKKLDIKVTENGNNTYNLYAKVTGFKPLDVKNVKADKLADVVKKYVDEVLGESLEDIRDHAGNDLFSSCNVTLKRVCCAQGDEIHLVSVNCASVPEYAMNSIAAVLDNDEFVAQIAEEPASFAITNEDSDLDVEPCDECCTQSDTYILDMIAAANSLLHFVQYIHWNAKGEDMREIHSLTDSFKWSLQNQIDALAELQVELFDKIPPMNQICQTCCVDEACLSSSQATYTCLRDEINRYKSILELYICNLPADAQQMINTWIRDWSVQSNYFIKQITK